MFISVDRDVSYAANTVLKQTLNPYKHFKL